MLVKPAISPDTRKLPDGLARFGEVIKVSKYLKNWLGLVRQSIPPLVLLIDQDW